MMYGVCLLLFVLSVQTDGYTPDDTQCNYIFSQRCHEDVNNYNIVSYNSSALNYCTAEDVPSETEINFTMMLEEVGGRELAKYLKVDFKPPKTECRYGVTLLVNSSIKDESECAKYNFDETENIATKVHTTEKTLCIFTNTNRLVRYNDNSTISLCENNIEQWFQHIFTGCYALRFHVDGQYIIVGHTFLNTTYKRTEVVEPQFTCKYNTYFDLNESHEITNFTLDTSMSVDTGLRLKVELISNDDEDLQKRCVWYREKPINTWIVNLMNYAPENHDNCSVNVRAVSGEYTKSVQCNFQVQTAQAADYCFIFRMIDERCHINTLWHPPINGKMPCTWLKSCARTYESSLHVERVNATKSDKLLSTNTYLLSIIITAVLLVSLIIGMLCFWKYLRIHNEGINVYVDPQQDDSACLKSVNFDNVVDNGASEKRTDRNNLAYDDIVLLYTESSTSFMALMKNFRETLSKTCSCFVHDWHDEAKWNKVATVGPVPWFTDLFNAGCRIVWIDTPATRSVVISNSRGSDSNLNKLCKYYEIGDFRDLEFPVMLDLAKRNTKDSMYSKHFVVRFEGLESSENVNDPFRDLSPHVRYLMPQHLAQLCSDLSTVKPVISKYEMKTKEDLLQQHLRFMKTESVI